MMAPVDPGRLQRPQGAQVLRRGDPSGGDHGNPRGGRDGAELRKVRAFQHPITPDIGVDDGVERQLAGPTRQVRRPDGRCLRPSGDGEHPPARIQPERHPTGERGAGGLQELGVSDCRRAQDRHRRAEVQDGADRVEVSESAADLRRNPDRCEDIAARAAWLAGEATQRPVQIHEV